MTDESFVVTEKALIDWLKMLRATRQKFMLEIVDWGLIESCWNKGRTAEFVRKARKYEGFDVYFIGGYDVQLKPSSESEARWLVTIGVPNGGDAVEQLKNESIDDNLLPYD